MGKILNTSRWRKLKLVSWYNSDAGYSRFDVYNEDRLFLGEVPNCSLYDYEDDQIGNMELEKIIEYWNII